MPDNPIKNDSTKIAMAKLALAGEDEIEGWKKDNQYLERRRQEAAKAMASAEQEKAKEDIEKAKIDKIEAQKKLAELEAVRQREEGDKNKKLAEEQKKKDEQSELERLTKIDKILASQKEIETIKKNPQAGTAPIRTLTRDIGQTIQSEGLSAAKIITNTPDQKRTESSSYRVWLIGLITLLIIGGLFISLWSIWLRQTVVTANPLANRQSLIFANKQIAIDLDKKSSAELLTELNETKTNLAEVTSLETIEIYFTYQVSTTTEKGIVTTKNEAPVTAYNKYFNLNLPGDFTRQIEPQWMLGYSGKQADPFYIFKTNNLKNLADALLKNEDQVVSALLSPFVNASTTEKIALATFRDKMIKNYDARLVTDETNATIAIYSWLDQSTLLVTTNEDTFVRLLDFYSVSK